MAKKNFVFLIAAFLVGCGDSGQPGITGLSEISGDSLTWIHLNEGEKCGDYFVFEGEVYCGEVAYNKYPLTDIDPETFEVLPASSYARDKNHVLYPLQTICVDGKDWGNCHCIEYLMNDADPLTFLYLGYDYAKDNKHIFFRGKMISEADYDSFKVNEYGDAEDKNYAYNFGVAYSKEAFYKPWFDFHGIDENSETYKNMIFPMELEFTPIDLEDDYQELFREFYIYSPDSAFTIDLYSYSLSLEKDGYGKLSAAGWEVDNKVQLINLKNSTSAELIFCGSECFPEDAIWRNEHDLRIFGMTMTDNEPHPVIWYIDIEDKTELRLAFIQTSTRQIREYERARRLKSVRFID